MLANDRPDHGLLGHVLCEHRDLHAVLGAVRSIVREPGSPDPDRAVRLESQIVRLREHLAGHFLQEEQGGFMEESAVRLPRLARRVSQVLAEHPVILAELDDLTSAGHRLAAHRSGDGIAAWADLASRFEAFSRRLLEHERRENALVQEGYNEDLGLLD